MIADKRRKLTNEVIKTLERQSNGRWVVHVESGWTMLCPDEVAEVIVAIGEGAGSVAGIVVGVETILITQVVGWRVGDQWYDRKSDEDIDREHDEMVAGFERERRASLELNRADWQAREDALPAWAGDRLRHFRDRGGEYFEVEGWGYELTVSELAVLYADAVGELPASSLDEWPEEPASIMEYADKYGTSGNQHGFALALARAHRNGKDTSVTVSALSPLTGDADYSGGQ